MENINFLFAFIEGIARIAQYFGYLFTGFMASKSMLHCLRAVRSWRAFIRLMQRKFCSVARNMRLRLYRLFKRKTKHVINYRSKSSDELRPQPSRAGAVLDLLHPRGREECRLGGQMREPFTITIPFGFDAARVSGGRGERTLQHPGGQQSWPVPPYIESH